MSMGIDPHPQQKGQIVKKKALIFGMLILVFLACTAEQCTQEKNEYVTNVYRAMVISAVTYDTTMKSVADLYSQGLVDESFKSQAILYGTEYWKAYHSLQRILELYVKGVAEKDSVDQARAEFDTAFLNFMTYANKKEE